MATNYSLVSYNRACYLCVYVNFGMRQQPKHLARTSTAEMCGLLPVDLGFHFASHTKHQVEHSNII